MQCFLHLILYDLLLCCFFLYTGALFEYRRRRQQINFTYTLKLLPESVACKIKRRNKIRFHIFTIFTLVHITLTYMILDCCLKNLISFVNFYSNIYCEIIMVTHSKLFIYVFIDLFI